MTTLTPATVIRAKHSWNHSISEVAIASGHGTSFDNECKSQTPAIWNSFEADSYYEPTWKASLSELKLRLTARRRKGQYHLGPSTSNATSFAPAINNQATLQV